MTWTLLPFEGIDCEGVKLSLGQARGAVREAMKSRFQLSQNEAYPDEDDFLTADGSTFIRVRYDLDAVWDIEFLSGSLRYEGVDFHDRATLEDVRRHFESNGISLRPTEWLGDGWDCVPLGINIASHEDVGGDGDGIEWVIMSLAFTS